MSDRAFTLGWLHENSFDGFTSIEDIRSRRSAVAVQPGVYVVYRERLSRIQFMERSQGGWFKGRDPSVPVEKLEKKWIDDAHVLYIGKADAGSAGKRGIKVRIHEYMRFGQGEPIGHWGGRYLWQLDGTDQLFVCWKPCAHPSDEETRLLDLFRGEYGALPFANLKGGSRSTRVRVEDR